MQRNVQISLNGTVNAGFDWLIKLVKIYFSKGVPKLASSIFKAI